MARLDDRDVKMGVVAVIDFDISCVSLAWLV